MKKVGVVAENHSMSKNYFEIFDLPISYELDKALLHKQYIALQRIHHPDKPSNILSAGLSSAEISSAYTTLSSDILRAIYLLELSGVSLEKTETDQYILEETFEDRAKITGLSRVELEVFKESILNSIELLKIAFDDAYKCSLAEAVNCAIRFKYKHKLLEELNAELEA